MLNVMRLVIALFLIIFLAHPTWAQNTSLIFHERPFNEEYYVAVCERSQGGYYAYGNFRMAAAATNELTFIRYNSSGGQLQHRKQAGNLLQHVRHMFPTSNPGFIGIGHVIQIRPTDTLRYIGAIRYTDNMVEDSACSLSSINGMESMIYFKKGRYSGNWWLMTKADVGLILRRISADFQQVLAIDTIVSPTGNPPYWNIDQGDLLEFENPRRLVIALDAQFLGYPQSFENLWGLLEVDSNIQVTRHTIAYSYTTPLQVDRYGLISRNIRQGLAYGSDSTFLLYGQVREDPTFNGSNFCLSDSCIRQCQTEWSLKTFSRIRSWVSPYTRRPAYFQNVTLGIGNQHLVWGSKNYEENIWSGSNRNETSITLSEFVQPQRIARYREMEQVGYWLSPQGVTKCANGDYLMWGNYFDFQQNTQYWSASLAFFTRFNMNNPFIVNARELAQDEVTFWKLNPNPINDLGFSLDIENSSANTHFTFRLSDMQGKVHLQRVVEAGKHQWAKPAMPPGMYMASLECNGRLLGTKKVVLLP